MLLAAIVIVNGTFVPSSPPTRTLFGHVVAPLALIAARIADRVSVDGERVTIERGAHRCLFRIGSPAFRCDGASATAPVTPFARAGSAYVPLAPLARAFGAQVAYDARAGTLAIVLPSARPLFTPAPFDRAAPQATPTQIFTPQPPPPTPQAVQSGDPLPRRTAIPVTPSRVPPP